MAVCEKIRRSVVTALQLKTWLVGILKHKVIDQLRRHSRECTIVSDDHEADIDELFKAEGHWREAPQYWAARSRP